MKKNNLILFNNFNKAFQELSDDNAGKLIKKLFHYHLTGENLKTNEFVDFMFNTMKELLDKSDDNYNTTCERNRANIKKRWAKKDTTVYDRIPDDTKNTNIREDKIIEKNIKDIYIPSKPSSKIGRELEVSKPILNQKIPFENFYSLYPRKVSKGAAEKSWNKLTLEEQKKVINKLQSKVFKDWFKEQNKDQDYRPHPSTWLNQKRWEDELKGTIVVIKDDLRTKLEKQAKEEEQC